MFRKLLVWSGRSWVAELSRGREPPHNVQEEVRTWIQETPAGGGSRCCSPRYRLRSPSSSPPPRSPRAAGGGHTTDGRAGGRAAHGQGTARGPAEGQVVPLP